MGVSGNLDTIIISSLFFLLLFAFIILLQHYRKRGTDVKARRKSISYLTSIFLGIDVLLGFIFVFVLK